MLCTTYTRNITQPNKLFNNSRSDNEDDPVCDRPYLGELYYQD